MRKEFRKVISALLTVSMTASLFSGIAFAEGTRKLFDEAEKTPRLIVTSYSGSSTSEKYESAFVKLASPANAAIATASDAIEIVASPSSALDILDVDLDVVEGGSGTIDLKINLYKDKDNYYDYRATMSNATETVTVGVKTDDKTYQGEVELVCNWFWDLNQGLEPHEGKIELERYRLSGRLKDLMPGTEGEIKVYDMRDENTEITDTEGWFEKKTDKIIFNTKAIKKEDRKEKHTYRIELYGKDNKIYGYCYVVVYPLPSMDVDGVPVNMQSVYDYMNGLDEEQSAQIEKLEITGGSMSATDWNSIKKLKNLQSLTVSDDVERVGTYGIPASAFEGMKSLETVSINDPGEAKAAGPRAASFINAVKSIGEKAFKDCTNLKTVKIPGIQTISAKAFENCSSLSDLEAFDTEDIYSEAFSGCTSLKEVNFLNLYYIWEDAFKNFTGLEKIILPRIGIIDDHAFWNCINLKSMDLRDHAPSFWTSDVMGVFEGVPKPLREFRLVDRNGKPLEGYDYTRALGDYREGYSADGNHTREYKLWKELLGFSDPSTTMTVYVDAGSGANAIEGDSLNACIESFLAKYKELKKTDIVKLVISSDKSVMTQEDWKTAETLTSLTWLQIGYPGYPCNLREEIPAGVKMPKQLEYFFLLNENEIEIPDSMLEGCTRLVSVEIDKVTKIGSRAFAGCNALQSLKLPETPPQLGNNVFADITPRGCLYPVSGNLDQYKEEVLKGGNAGQWQTVMKSEETPTPTPDPTPDPKPEPKPESGNRSGSSASRSGQWILNDKGWWYDFGNGLWPSNQWRYLYYNGRSDWYFFDQEGYMVTGWYTDAQGRRYYLHPLADGRRGYMYTGWNQIDGAWYYFSTESGDRLGSLLKNTTTPDGYAVDENGIWRQ